MVYILVKTCKEKRMDYGIIAIVAICALVLLIGTLKQKSRIVFQFLMRASVGLVCIYFFNDFLKSKDISISVGLNPISFLTVGSLGISGVALLYGIMLYRTL